ncbi:MAG: AAA family ATPase [Halorubrum sp.]
MSNRDTTDSPTTGSGPDHAPDGSDDEPTTDGGSLSGDEPPTVTDSVSDDTLLDSPGDVDDDPTATTGVDSGATPGELVVVCGLPGVGKTTVAKRIANHVDAEILRTDVIRKELFPNPTYADEETEAVYAELIARARDRVTDGDAVVLDATFADARFREDVRQMAQAAAAGFELVKVECAESVVKRRIERRDGISDADFDIHLRFKQLFDGIDADHRVVDNSGGETATFDQVDDVFG